MNIPIPESGTSIAIAFVIAAIVILFGGTRLTGVADRLADRTGLGEAVVGTVLLGAITSLAGLATSVTAAWNGLPELAVSNSAGGIAAQTFFIAVADLVYRRANLEHAAASLQNMIQGTVLIGCLALAISLPSFTIYHSHRSSPRYRSWSRR